MNVYLDMVGCRLNQAEIENYARQFHAAGHNMVASPENADLVVVNTCAVTGAAASDSRQKIRQAARAGADVVVTGCWSSLEKDTAAKLPGVRQVIPNAQKDALVALILGDPQARSGQDQRLPVAGRRRRTRAFIKVQDGCDNHCTYCITRLARGPSRSCSIEEVLADIHAAQLGGAQEVVLTGVQIGSWGKDLHAILRLSTLINAILCQSDIPRLRISSIEPWEVDDELIKLWQNPRLCRHFHLPMQSGSPVILKRMARKTSPQEFLSLVDKIRKTIQGVSITTDIITGFPGEGEAEFAETLALINLTGLSGGHVFVYSPRPGTASAGYPDKVPVALSRLRSKILRECLSNQTSEFEKQFLGQRLAVLWENSVKTPDGWRSSGLSDNYIKVIAATPAPCQNTINKVLVQNIESGGLSGEVLDHEA